VSSLPPTADATVDQIDWTMESRPAALEALLLSDDDSRRERDLFREMLSLALSALHDRTCELAHERDQRRRLREHVVRPPQSRTRIVTVEVR
jgi:hypothetical protein